MLLANKVPPIISQLGFSFCELNGVVFRADIQPVKKENERKNRQNPKRPGCCSLFLASELPVTHHSWLFRRISKQEVSEGRGGKKSRDV